MPMQRIRYSGPLMGGVESVEKVKVKSVTRKTTSTFDL
jgi:hypothetical protein